jgi:hypothetical protein
MEFTARKPPCYDRGLHFKADPEHPKRVAGRSIACIGLPGTVTPCCR